MSIFHNTTPPISELDIFAVDLNGQLRGKRLPLSYLKKLHTQGFKMPRSVLTSDYWGADVDASGLIHETGDSDGVCFPVTKKASAIPWLAGEQWQMLASMKNADGSDFILDPRQFLVQVVSQFKALGFTPVVATELEFYLLNDKKAPSMQPPNALFDPPGVLDINRLDQAREFLNDIRHAAQIQSIPVDSCTAEMSNHQFECNLLHVDDAVLAADHAVLFKRLAQGVARKHHQHATFMPKPFMEKSGNGFHLHFSLLDSAGQNAFDNGTVEGSALLKQAVAGLLMTMQDAMLIFAPNQNSYRRYAPGSHAPGRVNWAYENRTTALRIPNGDTTSQRIEHRVAGADANPYLVIAAVLLGALHGIQNQLTPPAASEGNAYEDTQSPLLPHQWYPAIERFRDSKLLHQLMGEDMVRTFAAIKEQEHHKLNQYISPLEYSLYL